jgi:uncharacterized RDD family membrane protein YckC
VTRRALTDPTAVVARRGGAWFIDAVLCALAGAVPALLLADAYSFDRPGNGVTFERPDGDLAIFVRDTVVVLRPAEVLVTGGALLAGLLLVLVLLPGRRGWSPGYLAADLRLVRHDGERVGIGRALVRALAWVVDVLPGLPLVAYGFARATRHHQRLGDKLAGTYVVDKRAAGRPIDQPLGGAEPLAPVVADEPEVEPFWDEERADDPLPDPVAEPEPTPEPEPVPPPTAAASEPPDGVPADQPIWDRRNQRYVLWHSKAGRWLAHTDTGWAPFEGADTGDATRGG